MLIDQKFSNCSFVLDGSGRTGRQASLKRRPTLPTPPFWSPVQNTFLLLRFKWVLLLSEMFSLDDIRSRRPGTRKEMTFFSYLQLCLSGRKSFNLKTFQTHQMSNMLEWSSTFSETLQWTARLGEGLNYYFAIFYVNGGGGFLPKTATYFRQNRLLDGERAYP